MCGIAGFAGAGSSAVLHAMTQALAHRGPDGEGFYIEKDSGTVPVYLGHRRLAVLDIDGGVQPMWSADRRIGVVFNGEIYNFRSLRRELTELGYHFQTSHSDTEVLIHGYVEWGAELPLRLNGMFAFAIFDRHLQRLFLARDRFGEKPLYYAQGTDFFGFASELPALALHPCVDSRWDRLSIQKYFAYGYIPAPRTLFRGAHKLPPGHTLTHDLATGASTTRCYWRFRLEPNQRLLERPVDELASELRSLVFQAVERRLVSDVPLGVCLSGGIDSSSILAAAVHAQPDPPISTFTIGFLERSFDESRYARDVAAAFRSRHHESILEIDAVRDLIPEILPRLGEPLADASILPTYLLARFMRRHVTVALSGDGGDELFAGYDPFKALGLARIYQALVPRPVHRGLRRVIDQLPISRSNMGLDFKLRRTLGGLSYRQALWNPVWLGPLEPDAINEMLDERISPEDLYSEAISLWERPDGGDIVDRSLEFFTNLYLTEDILVKADRASMMASLETRAIFLDNDLVDFCQRLPNELKFRNGDRKFLLKRAMRGVLPRSVLQRRKKGFGIPLSEWLMTEPKAPPMAPIEMIDTAPVMRRWQEHRSGQADHRLFLWSWLSLQSLLGVSATVPSELVPS